MLTDKQKKHNLWLFRTYWVIMVMIKKYKSIDEIIISAAVEEQQTSIISSINLLVF